LGWGFLDCVLQTGYPLHMKALRYKAILFLSLVSCMAVFFVICCRDNVVTITELMEQIRKLQNVSDSSKLEKIAQVLDEDHDGVIDKDVLMEVPDGFVLTYKSTDWHEKLSH